MRVVIACVAVIVSVFAALGLAQSQNVFSFMGQSATASVSAPAVPTASHQIAAKSTTSEKVVATLNSAVVVASAPEAAPKTEAVKTETATPVAAAPQPVAVAPAAPMVVAQAAPAPAQARPAPAAAPAQASCPGNPNALGVSRVVEIDTTGGPGFGSQHFKQMDFLQPGEVVLTFDDGPWLNHTHAVLTALARHCTKAIFFPIGKHTTYYPDILKEVAAGGHTIGSHTWSHQDLSKKTTEEGKVEIEMAISAVRQAIGDDAKPFFRFPALKHPPELVTYLGERNIAIWSTDIDSFDFKFHKPERVVSNVMAGLKKWGKGIVLMHDFQKGTSEAIGDLLDQMKAGGYKIVQVKAKGTVKSMPEYDAMLVKENKLPTVSNRPVGDVVKTISQ
jgi:peptidoglycan/xylan/chitin deacetylase (PgdA/CDA1 family)